MTYRCISVSRLVLDLKIASLIDLWPLLLDLSPQYALGDSVTLWVNKVGPYNNPQETYNYYTLPFCKPGEGKERPEHKWGGLGEVLEGNELIDSQLSFKFRSEHQFICAG